MPTDPLTLVLAGATVFLLVAFIVMAVSRLLLHRKIRRLTSTQDADRAAAAAARKDAEGYAAQIRKEAERDLSVARRDLAAIKQQSDELHALRNRLHAEVAALQEDSESISVGLYRPHFSYKDSGHYKIEIDRVRSAMKQLVKDGQAVASESSSWSLDNNRKEGERMRQQYLKCMLRAFNGECDAAVANVTWSNVVRMEERLLKAFESINKLGDAVRMHITPGYRDLRLQELRLVHEHEQKKREEAEEQRRIREQMREEERVLREIERERQDAEADERRFQRALEVARREAAKAKGAEVDELNDRVRLLEAQLQEAHDRGERAIARAQETKQGHIYVISNIGSFGDDVVKIGMTRRLDPMERVKELGDASVPFEFDVHAMIFSDDAPALEARLHREMDQFRVNLVNQRKEFFRVPLDAIEACASRMGVSITLTKIAEAREYRETSARRQAQIPMDGPS